MQNSPDLGEHSPCQLSLWKASRLHKIRRVIDSYVRITTHLWNGQVWLLDREPMSLRRPAVTHV